MAGGGIGDEIHVLVIDDSAVVRNFAWGLLTKSGGMSVETAADPIIGQLKIQRRRPDVIILDLNMPRMDGLTFLRQLMTEDPIPVIVCSGYADTEAGVQALELGAIEVLAKPKLGLQDYLYNSSDYFLEAVRAAAGVQDPGNLWAQEEATTTMRLPKAKPLAAEPIVAIGASSGGTQTLRYVLERLPRNAPGIVVVQHMPEHFTRTFAEHLNDSCVVRVQEAGDGDVVRRGRVLIAPGNRHLVLDGPQNDEGWRVRLDDGPEECRHRPSVDVLFRSVARVAGSEAIGVILSGMGNDGVAGLQAMKEAGAMTLAQNEATCAIFGMPKRALLSGAADRAATPDTIAEILRQNRREELC